MSPKVATFVNLICAWCGGPIPANTRRDSITCSKRCRQARWRFLRDVGHGTAGTHTLRMAYADPPYPGLSRRYYGEHADYAGEVDHAALLSQLATFDGWALSTSTAALPEVLALCPKGTRVAAWVRGEAGFAKSNRPLNGWEPVLYFGGRAVQSEADVRRVDTLVYHAHPRLTDPKRVVGAKPAVFIRWMFDLLGAQPQDEFTDMFPGSGGVTRAWSAFCRASTGQLSLELSAT